MVFRFGRADAAALRAAGRIVLFDDLAQRAFVRYVRGLLSGREARVLELTAMGAIDKGIADELRIAVSTVRIYWERIFHKLHRSTRASAVALWTWCCVSALSGTRQPPTSAR